MKFRNTVFWKTYPEYEKIVANSSMRATVDAILLWRLIQHFKFKKFLEIGIYQGLTTGLFLEASGDGTVVGIDPASKLDLFYKNYADSQHRFTLIQEKSQNVDLSGEYDFILLDSDHYVDYEFMKYDLDQTLPLLNKSGILAINCSLEASDPLKLIDELYTSKTDWVPFMRLEQLMLCHHVSSDRSEFLDSVFRDPISKFIFLHNEKNKHNDIVLMCKTLGIFTDFTEFFDLALERYDI